MKKFFKIFFSRFTLIFLAIVLQIGVAAVILQFFNSYYVPLRIITSVIAVLVLIGLINRDMNVDGKLPWAILVAAVPIVGVMLYFSFSRNYASRRERKLFAKLPQHKLNDVDIDAPQNVKGQINYLKEMGEFAFTRTYTKYFACGEQFFEDLITELNKAEKFIFMEYFIVERGKMFDRILEVLLRKAKEGVEVRLMYDDVGSLPHIKHSFNRKISKMGIKCIRFGKLKPIISAVYNNRDHRKITVIDGKTGYVGGINLADEYINETHPLGYWKDTAVRLEGAAVASLSLMYLQMFDMAQNATEPFEKYIHASFGDEQQDKTHNCGVVIPFGDGPKPIYRDYVARSVYLNIINQSQQDLYITTPYLIVDDAFVDALRRAALRGVNVNIIIPAVPDKKAVYCMTRQGCGKLVDAGVKIYSYTPGFIHAKGIVADGKVGVVGTINLDYRSFVHHYECGVFMYDAQAVAELQQDMFAVIAQSQPMLTNVKLRWWEKVVCVFANVFRPLL